MIDKISIVLILLAIFLVTKYKKNIIKSVVDGWREVGINLSGCILEVLYLGVVAFLAIYMLYLIVCLVWA